MRKLGRIQLEVLRSYYAYGYFPGGAWVYDTYSNTLKVTESLAKHGLVEQVDYTYPIQVKYMPNMKFETRKVYKITNAGRDQVHLSFPNITRQN